MVKLPNNVDIHNLIDDLRIFSWEAADILIYYSQMLKDSDLKKKIIKNFGIESYKNNKIDNQFLSDKIFENTSYRLKINSLVHPFVKEDFHFWIKKNSNSNYLVKESALIIESKSYKELDFLIYVSAERSTRIKRVLERDTGRNEDDIVKIIETQMNDKKAIDFCDEVIDNNFNYIIFISSCIPF